MEMVAVLLFFNIIVMIAVYFSIRDQFTYIEKRLDNLKKFNMYHVVHNGDELRPLDLTDLRTIRTMIQKGLRDNAQRLYGEGAVEFVESNLSS